MYEEFSRRFGRHHSNPCNDPNVLTCAMWECQKANRCVRRESQMMGTGSKIIAGAQEAPAVAKGTEPADSFWHNGFRYVPEDALATARREGEESMREKALDLITFWSTDVGYSGDTRLSVEAMLINRDADMIRAIRALPLPNTGGTEDASPAPKGREA